MDRVRWVRCAHCGEIIGAYEAARLVLRDGSHRCGSCSTLGELIETPGAAVVHEGCYEPSSKCATARLQRQTLDRRCSDQLVRRRLS